MNTRNHQVGIVSPVVEVAGALPESAQATCRSAGIFLAGHGRALQQRRVELARMLDAPTPARPDGRRDVLMVGDGAVLALPDLLSEASPGMGAFRTHFVGVDAQVETLAVARRCCEPWREQVAWVQANPLRLRMHQRFDLVWCDGPFEQLDDLAAAALLARLIDLVRPDGGRLVTAHLNAWANRSDTDAPLRGRRLGLLHTLARACGAPDSTVSVWPGAGGLNLYLQVTVSH